MNEQKYTQILDQLLSGPTAHSYWARKSRLLALEGELSPLEYKLLEFDVAFKFNHAKDLARSAERIFKADKSNERVRQSIGRLFSVLLNTPDRKFSTEVVRELSMETLQEMFFFAFPEQRNSTKGSLQVYLTLASNQPQSLGTIATKLFAYYLGASAEFQRNGGLLPTTATAMVSAPNREEEITPMDGVLFYLFDSLVQARFGDLSIHNTTQIFHIVLRNCFADSMGRVPADFYSQSGIACLGTIQRPSSCWHICFHVLAHLFQQRVQQVLLSALEPLPQQTNGEVQSALKRAIAHQAAGPEMIRSSEFVRLALSWTMATSGIRTVQSDPSRMFVHVPANIFWIEPSALDRYWFYNLDVEDEDSPAEPGEPQQPGEEGVERALQIDEPALIEPIGLLNSLFQQQQQQEGGVGPSVAEMELPRLGMPNAHSIAALALMASENWKQAMELLQRSQSQLSGAATAPSIVTSEQQQLILRVELLQALIAQRKLDQAFPLALELLAKLTKMAEAKRTEKATASNGTMEINGCDEDGQEADEFPALIVSQESCWVQLTHHTHLLLYTQLLHFHLCWLAYAKCQQNSNNKMAAQNGELMFLVLVLLIQACWADYGFGLFEQLVEHVALKTHFRCPGLLAHCNNARLLGELLGVEQCQMDLCTPSEQSANFKAPSEIFKEILAGTALMSREQLALAILTKCFEDNRSQLATVFASLH